MFKKSAELFEELKSETRPKDLVMQMSGGQRQAVAIARTRLTNPKLVLMDEPTAAISVRQVAEVLDLIKRLKDQGIAVLLISHRMPDIFEVCEKLKSDPETHRIPIIFVTAENLPKDRFQGLGLGAIDYITKPFNPEDLSIKVFKYLAHD